MKAVSSVLIAALRPHPINRVQFSWSQFKQVPAVSGCYVLTNFSGEVLYVGQASTSIRDRFCAHLETPEKRALGPFGVPFWCYFLPYDKQKISLLEQGWMNQVVLNTGSRPILNKLDAPI